MSRSDSYDSRSGRLWAGLSKPDSYVFSPYLADYGELYLDLTPRSPDLADYRQVCPDLTPRSQDMSCLDLISRSSDLADYGVNYQDLTPRSPYLVDWSGLFRYDSQEPRSVRLWSDLS